MKLRNIIGSEDCALVGRDPVLPDEGVPLVHTGRFQRPTIWGKYAPWKVDLVVRAWQCVGMEGILHDSLETLKEKVVAQQNSVDRSLEWIMGYATTAEVKRALEILEGRLCRRFDVEENRAFGLMEGSV